MTIQIERLSNELEKLARFSRSVPPNITRVVYSKEDLQARDYLTSLFEEAGLEVKVDPLGNTFARWAGRSPELPAVGTGSHIDAIPDSGKYDGTVGVLGALEAVRALKSSGFVPERSIEILLFTSEEPTRFGIGCLGSRMLSGMLKPENAAKFTDEDQSTLEEVRLKAGFTGDLQSVSLEARQCYDSFVELHIEQGPLLEEKGYDIGVVEAIAAPATIRVVFEGDGGHAGAVLMEDRKDALLAASELVLFVNRAARSSDSKDSVATVGKLHVSPGAVNSIPRRVLMEIDIRDIQENTRNAIVKDILDECCDLAHKYELSSEQTVLNQDPPAICSDIVLSAIEKAVESSDVKSIRMISRAYHDSLFMARLFPTAMIFIPCREGISHRPEEYSSPEQIEKGVRVLAHTLSNLSRDIQQDK